MWDVFLSCSLLTSSYSPSPALSSPQLPPTQSIVKDFLAYSEKELTALTLRPPKVIEVMPTVVLVPESDQELANLSVSSPVLVKSVSSPNPVPETSHPPVHVSPSNSLAKFSGFSPTPNTPHPQHCPRVRRPIATLHLSSLNPLTEGRSRLGLNLPEKGPRRLLSFLSEGVRLPMALKMHRFML